MPEKLDLTPLQEQIGTKPRTKFGQVKQAWPEIQQLRAEGHTVKDIWALVCQCGISIGYGRFAGYVHQLAKRGSPARIVGSTPILATGASDSLQGIRDRRPKPFYTANSEEGLNK